MAESDNILKKALSKLDKKLKEAEKEESRGNIEHAIGIREEVLSQFAGMNMNNRVAEQYEKIYKLAKDYGDKLDKEGNRAAGIWYKRAEEVLSKLQPDDKKKKEIEKLRANTRSKVVDLYKEKKKGLFFGQIVASGMKQAAYESFTEKDKAGEEKGEFERKMNLDKGVIGKLLSSNVYAHLEKENALHKAMSLGKAPMGEAVKDIKRHIKAGKRLALFMNHGGAAHEFIYAAELCSYIKDNRATLLFIKAGDEFMKSGAKIGETDKNRIVRHQNAVLAYVSAKEEGKLADAIQKLEEIYKKKIKSYIRNGLLGPAKEEIDEAANFFSNLGFEENAGRIRGIYIPPFS